MTGYSFAFKFVLLLLVYIIYVRGQFPPSGIKFVAATEDVPHISCSVCAKAVRHIRRQVIDLRKETSIKGKTVDEDDILTIVEASCNPDKKQGGWILKYDIVDADGRLHIVEHESQSRCQQECRTISKACEESIGDIDTDLGELLWKDELQLSKLINKVCYEMTDICTRKIPKFKKGKRNDEVFKPMNDEEKKAYDMMNQLKSAPGMPQMQAFHRDDIEKMKGLVNNPQSNDIADNEEGASFEAPFLEQTKLGFIDTIKAAMISLYGSVKKLFSFGWKRTEF